MSARSPASTTFMPTTRLTVVRDGTLDGRPVLLLGWWLDRAGQVTAVEVATFTSSRRPHDIAAFPTPPAEPLPGAPGAFVTKEPVDA